MNTRSPGGGRRPKPVQQKALSGNPGGRPLNHNEPKFPTVLNIQAPSWVTGLAKEMWERGVPMLCDQRILTFADLHNVEIFCSAYEVFRLADDDVTDRGIIVPGARGVEIKNPALTAKNEAIKQMISSGSLLGLDPSSRQRLMGPAPSGSHNPFTDLI